MREKQCPECGDKIIGRTDKKFCSDGCRNTFNNRINKDQKNLIRNINNRLRKNWRILEQLNPQQKTKKPRAQLVALGFDFRYFFFYKWAYHFFYPLKNMILSHKNSWDSQDRNYCSKKDTVSNRYSKWN